MIETWTRVHALGMDESLLADLRPTVQRHPWWRARAKLVAALLEQTGVPLGGKILDAGCGWGVTLEHLERRGYQVTGLDASRRMLEALDGPPRRLVVADITQHLPIFEQFDAVLALDVIEHLDDDPGALRNLARLVRPGGVLAVSVPADPALYGEFDAVQGHRRRYTQDMLAQVFVDSGVALERGFCWGAWLAPFLKRQRAQTRGHTGETPAAIYSRYLRLPPLPVRWAIAAAFALEQPRALMGRLRRGTSLFAIARRPQRPVSSVDPSSREDMMTSAIDEAMMACPAGDGWHQSR